MRNSNDPAMAVLASAPAVSAVAERRFGEEEEVFKGHFPRTKILPGVLLVGFALETAEAHLRRRGDPDRLVRISSAKFLAPVFPGHTVRCECAFEVQDHAMGMKAVLTRGGTVCATVKAVFSEPA